MKISEQEIKKVRKTLLLNLIAADLIIGLGLIVYFWGGHKIQMGGFFITVLGLVWAIMAVNRMMRFKKFLADQRK